MHENILNTSLKTYVSKILEIQEGVLQLLQGGYQNIVCRYYEGEKNFIVRITPENHRSFRLIESEIDFINYLYENGINVLKAIPITNDELIDTIEVENSKYYVVKFQEAKGHTPQVDKYSEWNIELFYNWGKTVGKMHNLSKKYIVKGNIEKRPVWYEDNKYVNKIEESLLSHDYIITEKYNKIVNDLKAQE